MQVRNNGLWLAAAGLVLMAGVVSCGDSGDSTTPLEPSVSISPSAVQAEVGGPPVSLLITARQGSTVFPAGTLIVIGEADVITSGVASAKGHFGEAEATDANRGQTQRMIVTDNGSVEVDFYCDVAGTTNIVAQPQGSTIFGQLPFTCLAGPDGTWKVARITADGDRSPGGKSVTITAEMTKDDGSPVDIGTAVVFSVEQGEEFLKFADGTTTKLANANDVGEASVNMVTGSERGEAVIAVNFQDARFGLGLDESFLIDTNDPSGDTELRIVIKKNGQTLTEAEEWGVLADGFDQLTVEAEIVPPDGTDFPVMGTPITIRKTNGPGLLRVDENDPTENDELTINADERGRVSAVFEGGDSAGSAALVISLTDPNPAAPNREIEEDVNINVTALGFIEYVGAAPEVLAVRGSGQNETSTVTFRVLDTNRNPLEGQTVTFSLDQPPAQTTLNRVEVVSNAAGVVETTVQSGIAAGSFSVRAEARLGDTILEAPSASIPVVGARPSRKGWQLNCELRNIGGLIGRQGDSIVVDEQYTCDSVLLDRFQNPIGIEQSVIFESEGGQIISPQLSIDWPAGSPEPPDNVGQVQVPYRPLGLPPCDVEPLDEEIDNIDYREPWIEVGGNCSVTLNGCPQNNDAPSCIKNPRDGLVTVRASTNGEEEFNDVNGNGVYDEGEPFWDLGEPLMDTNDNNAYDEGEGFVDLGSVQFPDGNSEYDGPNGEWDAQSTIWVSTRILLSGGPFFAGEPTILDGEPLTRTSFAYTSNSLVPFEGGLLPGPPAGMGSVYPLSAWWQDENLNRLNSSARYTVSLQGNPRGVRIVGLSGSDPVDSYGNTWDVTFNSIAAGGNVNQYVTRVGPFAPDRDGNPTVTGIPFRAQIEVTNSDPACVTLPCVAEFEATYQTSPGVGGTVTVAHSVPFLLPAPIE